MSVKNIVLAAAGQGGGANLYVEDVFSTYLYTGNGTTQVIENGIKLGDQNSGGSGYFDGSGDYLTLASPTTDIREWWTTDFTAEAWIFPTTFTGWYYTRPTGDHPVLFGNNSTASTDNYWSFGIASATGQVRLYYYNGGTVYGTLSTETVKLNQWNHVAFTKTSSGFQYWVNGIGSGNITISGTPQSGSTIPFTIGSGNNVYINGYVSNVRIIKGTALYTTNFTPPTAPLTAVSGTSLLTLQGDTPFVDNSGNSFSLTVNGDVSAKSFGPFVSSEAGEGGMVWLKSRNGTTSNFLMDTARGSTYVVSSNGTDAQFSATTGITSFNANGFTLGSRVGFNTSADTMCSWTFRKAPKFFDVVTYTGDGTSNRQIPHNLGSVPGMIITKKTSSTSNWAVYHRGIPAGGETGAILLNSTNGFVTSGAVWNDTAPTDTEFTVGGADAVNINGQSYVAYLFAHDAGGFGDTGGESVVACGSFTTGSTGVETITLGYEPQYVMMKRADSTGNWIMMDTMRGMPVGGVDAYLYANTSGAETTASYGHPTATGFVIDAGFGSGQTYIYLAIRRPMKTPESGTEVFSPVVQNSAVGAGGVAYNFGFPPDAVIEGVKGGAAYSPVSTSRLTGDYNFLQTSATSAEATEGGYRSYTRSMLGLTYNTFFDFSGVGGAVGFGFRRAPGFFDVVCYTGTGTAITIPHNLTVKPELIIQKRRNGADAWYVFVQQNGFGTLNSTVAWGGAGNGSGTDTIWQASVATVALSSGLASAFAASGSTNVIYLFASLPGISKVGSYTGTGTTLDINCGFTTGARFVLIKRTDSTGDWYVWDTARGIVSGNDPYLLLNSTAAEVTSTDYIDPLASGFQISSTAPAAINASGGSFIYLAIA